MRGFVLVHHSISVRELGQELLIILLCILDLGLHLSACMFGLLGLSKNCRPQGARPAACFRTHAESSG